MLRLTFLPSVALPCPCSMLLLLLLLLVAALVQEAEVEDEALASGDPGARGSLPLGVQRAAQAALPLQPGLTPLLLVLLALVLALVPEQDLLLLLLLVMVSRMVLMTRRLKKRKKRKRRRRRRKRVIMTGRTMGRTMHTVHMAWGLVATPVGARTPSRLPGFALARRVHRGAHWDDARGPQRRVWGWGMGQWSSWRWPWVGALPALASPLLRIGGRGDAGGERREGEVACHWRTEV